MADLRLFTSESVSEGHPDKVSDRISDAVVDTFLAADPYARVACETLCTTNRIVLAGEVRGPASITPALLEEVARAAVLKAQQLLDAGDAKAEEAVSIAKAMSAMATTLSVQEGVQMHGGIGMTDEYDIGLYMKRDRALEEFFGDARFHAERVARMSGY